MLVAISCKKLTNLLQTSMRSICSRLAGGHVVRFSHSSKIDSRRGQARGSVSQLALMVVAASAVVCFGTVGDAFAGKRQREAVQQQPVERQVTSPVTVMVSLNKQRMFVYDANGYVTQSRVSTGMPGYDTPKGIYSIIQKKVEHSSNIYEGASMPYMQRLLQTGIAMHGGVVPGYPASHGCIRLPFDFAPKLFKMTQMNERVIVTPDVQAPVSVEHPNLFVALAKGRSDPTGASVPVADNSHTDSATRSDLGSIIGVTPAVASEGWPTMASVEAQRAAERDRLVTAVSTAKDAHQTALNMVPETRAKADDARKTLRAREIALGKAQSDAQKLSWKRDQLAKNAAFATKTLDKKTARMRADQAEALRAQTAAMLTDLEALKAEADRAVGAQKDAKAAFEAARRDVDAANKAAVEAKKAVNVAFANIGDSQKAVESYDRQSANRNMPLSVLISQKTGKISLRQGWETLAEGPVEIEGSGELGSYLFTANTWLDQSETTLKWQVVSAGVANPYAPEAVADRKSKKKVAEQTWMPPSTDVALAQQTLGRIKIPLDMRIKVAELIKPGSTVIISDYDMARSETRPGTDFIVQMPEVIAKISKPVPSRRRVAVTSYDDDNNGGLWFFGGSSQPKPNKEKKSVKRVTVSPKWGGGNW